MSTQSTALPGHTNVINGAASGTPLTSVEQLRAVRLALAERIAAGATELIALHNAVEDALIDAIQKRRRRDEADVA